MAGALIRVVGATARLERVSTPDAVPTIDSALDRWIARILR
jgi:hypothetical protein